jgi:mannose-6-phosphate isomerase-like protein (cupin superfamily)
MAIDSPKRLSRDPVRKPTVFHYRPPEPDASMKAAHELGETDLGREEIQIYENGADNNLHFHEHIDGFRFVISGRARVFTTDDVLLGEIGPMDGVVVPRGFPYRIESVGDVPLEFVHLQAYDRPMNSRFEIVADRVDCEPRGTR